MVAWVRQEPSAPLIRQFLLEAGAGSLDLAMSWIKRRGIMAAARIKAAHAVAFGDAFAIALAQAEQGSVITGDGEIRWCGLVPVDWVGL
jgi:hypothetical protein